MKLKSIFFERKSFRVVSSKKKLYTEVTKVSGKSLSVCVIIKNEEEMCSISDDSPQAMNTVATE